MRHFIWLLFPTCLFVSQGQGMFQPSTLKTSILNQIQNSGKVDSENSGKGHEVREEMLEKYVRDFLGRLGQETGHRLQIPGKSFLEGSATKAIGELCGTSSSLTCAKRIDFLTFTEDDDGASGVEVDDMWERCQARKDFLACIEAERAKCKDLAESGYYPLLPPKSEIKTIQENAWKRLWTSGACVLQA